MLAGEFGGDALIIPTQPTVFVALRDSRIIQYLKDRDEDVRALS